jgi:hypothetical protein
MGGVDVYIHVLLTSALVWGEFHASIALLPEKEPPCTHCVGDLVELIVGLDDMEKLKLLPQPGLELRSFDSFSP